MDPRQLALDILRRISTQGAFAGPLLRSALPPDLKDVDRGLITELVYGVLRQRGALDRALRKAAGKRLKDLDPKLHDVLRLAAYQLIFLDRIPDHAAVNSGVELAKSRAGRAGAGRTNQILRTLTRTPRDERVPQPPSFAQDPLAHVAAIGSVNTDIASILIDALGPQTARAFVLASLHSAPQSLRANLLQQDPKALQEELGAEPGHLPYAVRLPDGLRRLPSDLDAVRDGRASPQDEASMRVVELLAPQPGESILDVCSAPGGKSCHAAEKMQNRGEVFACDRLPERLNRVQENAERLGLTCIQTLDLLPELDSNFDRVLVDAPCSGLGTLRRHPEIRWRFKKDDLEPLVRTQDKVLRSGAERVRPGGVLVYSVCTVSQAEGPDRIQSLLSAFDLEEELFTGPQDPGQPDGFYAARLRKKQPV